MSRSQADLRDLRGQTPAPEPEDEVHLHRRLLDEMKLQRAGIQQLSMSEEEQQEWSSSLDQETTDPPHIKEEQEELWSSQEGEQLQGLEEADTTMFDLNIITVKSEDDEEEPYSSQLCQRRTEQMETGANGEDCGGAESGRNSDPERHSQTDTEVKTRDFSGARTADSGNNKREIIVHQSVLCPEEKTEDKKPKTDNKSYSCSECSKTFKLKNNLTTHMRIHTGEKPFSCSVCCKQFKQKGHLTEHMIIHTGEKPFSCSICSKRFGHNSSLKLHMAYHRGEKPFSCSVCDERFSWCSQLQKHQCQGQASELHRNQTEENTEEETGAFKDCGGAEPGRNSDPERHLHPETEIKARGTQEQSSVSQSLDNTKNKRRVYKKKSSTSIESGNLFKKKQDPSQHMTSQSEASQLCCSECGKRFNKRGNLTKHMLIHRAEKPFSCPVCHKGFHRKGHLTRHMFVHSQQKPFSCSLCSKTFNLKYGLKRHMLHHSEEKLHCCSVCHQRFYKYSQLKRHVCFSSQPSELLEDQSEVSREAETGAEEENCGGAEPDKSSEPERHLQQETEVKAEDSSEAETEDSDDWRENSDHHLASNPVINLQNDSQKNETKSHHCTKCGKAFKSKRHLTQHARLHTGKKPFGCSQCGKRFYQKWNLTNHLLVHTGEKPFSCSMCRAGFKHRSSLKLHMAHHRGEKPFTCNICEKSFPWNIQLKTHKCVGGEVTEPHHDQTEEKREAESEADVEPEGHLQSVTKLKTEDSSEAGFVGIGEQANLTQGPQSCDSPLTCSTFPVSSELSYVAMANSPKNFHQKTEYSPKHEFENSDDSRMGDAKHQTSGNTKKEKWKTDRKLHSCPECDKTFSHKQHLIQHTRIHTGEKPFICPECGKRFNQNGNLTTHMLVHTGEKPFVCSVCRAGFKHKSSLKLHMAHHRGEKPFSCNNCAKSFQWLIQLKRHKCVEGEAPEPYNQTEEEKEPESDTEGEPGSSLDLERKFQLETKIKTEDSYEDGFVCLGNQANLSQWSQSATHSITECSPEHEYENCDDIRMEHIDHQIIGNIKNEKWKTDKKLHSCSECDKTFSKKRHLTQHARIHTGEKPFICPECGKKFNQNGNLTTHMLVHSGEKPFVCSVCSKSFMLKGNLTKHMIIHTGEKPFSCNECGKEFYQQGNLTSHMFIHMGEKPFSCSACGKHFREKGNLNRHKRVHRAESMLQQL